MEQLHKRLTGEKVLLRGNPSLSYLESAGAIERRGQGKSPKYDEVGE